MIRRAVHALMRRDLRAAFARVDWVGPVPALPPDASVVLYANHHNFYDGHLLWLAVEGLLGRHTLTWMEDWQRFPFFAAAGALPFPAGDARARAATVRRTARRFGEAPRWGLVYFPEGVLHPPEEGLLPFDEALLKRLDALLPRKVWLPTALYVTWDGEARPVARIAAGMPHQHVDGGERQRLAALWHELCTPAGPSRPLLEGRASPSRRWDFRFAAPFFRRYL